MEICKVEDLPILLVTMSFDTILIKKDKLMTFLNEFIIVQFLQNYNFYNVFPIFARELTSGIFEN